METMRAEAAATTSSSRRTVSRWLGLGLGLAALGGTGLLAARRPPLPAPERPSARGPLLVWEQGGAEPSKQDPHELARALWLVLGSLARETLDATLADVAELLDGVEARELPLGLDLTEAPPKVIAGRLRRALLPSWTSARTLVQGVWSASDRSLSVRLARPGERPNEGITAPAWADGERSGLAARARFLSWPVSSAVLVDAGTPQYAARLAARLRAEVVRKDALIALVLDGAVQRIDTNSLGEAELQRRELELRLRRFDERALTKRLGDAAPLALALRAGLPQGPVPSWIELQPSELLIVPRLSSLARRSRFLSELDRAARDVSPRAKRITT